jgi:hypothetical protein
MKKGIDPKMQEKPFRLFGRAPGFAKQPIDVGSCYGEGVIEGEPPRRKRRGGSRVFSFVCSTGQRWPLRRSYGRSGRGIFGDKFDRLFERRSQSSPVVAGSQTTRFEQGNKDSGQP